jgi:uncharacterized protein (TIGR02271 family)
MAQTVIGVFDSASDAQQAVSQLVSNGFSRDNIDVSSSNANAGTDINSTLSGSSYSGSSTSGTGLTGTGLTGTGSYTGSTTGDSTYGTTGSTLDTGSSREGTGSGIGNFFRSLFGNDDEADRYSGVASRSGSIVTVHAQSSDEAHRAADILDDNGAVDIDEKASQYGYGSTATSNVSDTNTSSALTTDTTQGATSIPIIEEELQVGKRTVQTGGARLRSRIVERPVEESLRLREERVTVDRTPVNRVATDADFAGFKEGTIELTEHAEVPVVSKEARVVEEVSLGKEVQEREETIQDTVRRTEVEVEKLDKDSLRNTTTNSGSSSTLTDSNDTFTTGSGTGSL